MHLASAHVATGNGRLALEILDNSMGGAVDEDLAYLRAPLGRVRASALALLDRFDEAADELSAALTEARSQHLVYEEALILAARCEIARCTNGAGDAEELLEAQRLQQLLGIPLPVEV